MDQHIILSAFGTTTLAQQTYGVIHDHIASQFRDSTVHLVYSSPTVRRVIRDKRNQQATSLTERLQRLTGDSSIPVLVQSLHVMPGHEFHRTVRETRQVHATAAIGMPLLITPDDYHRVAACLMPLIESHEDKAILILGHGSSHPSWTAYPTLEKFIRAQAGPRVFVAGLEKYPGSETVIDEIAAAGFKQVFVIPFLMVAGMHFQRDIIGESPASWNTRLQSRSIKLSFHGQGLALQPGIADIFCDHIRTGLDSRSG